MYISRISVDSNFKNFNLIDEWVSSSQRINPSSWWVDDTDNKIYISIADKMIFNIVNGFLKCNNLNYEVEAIRGKKEEVKSEFHYLIEG